MTIGDGTSSLGLAIAMAFWETLVESAKCFADRESLNEMQTLHWTVQTLLRYCLTVDGRGFDEYQRSSNSE